MRLLGLLGGMSWESTAYYYQLLNQGVRERLGGLHSARCLIHSVDFASIADMQNRGDWEEAGKILGDIAASLAASGAEALMLCTNTMHRVYDDLVVAAQIPVLHIADATAKAMKQQGVRRVGLLGTKFTMEDDLYRARLVQKGFDVYIPEVIARNEVHRIIYDELCVGIINEQSRKVYQRIVADFEANGAEGVILGCTEIGLLLESDMTSLPLFDTTRLHVEDAIEWSLG